LDIGPNYAGVLLGLSNTAGTMPGIVGVSMTGVILDYTHSWCTVFLITAVVYVYGAIQWLLLSTGKKILD